jgi:hypothetical protein
MRDPDPSRRKSDFLSGRRHRDGSQRCGGRRYSRLKELSIDTTEGGSAAATGAVKAPMKCGSGVAKQMRNAVIGNIAGVRVVLKKGNKTKTKRKKAKKKTVK